MGDNLFWLTTSSKCLHRVDCPHVRQKELEYGSFYKCGQSLVSKHERERKSPNEMCSMEPDRGRATICEGIESGRSQHPALLRLKTRGWCRVGKGRICYERQHVLYGKAAHVCYERQDIFDMKGRICFQLTISSTLSVNVLTLCDRFSIMRAVSFARSTALAP